MSEGFEVQISGNISTDLAQSFGARLSQMLAHPPPAGSPMPSLPGVMVLDYSSGNVRPIDHFLFNPILGASVMKAIAAKAVALFPDAGGRAIANEMAKRMIRASESQNMITADPVLPGAVSGLVTLQLQNDIGAIALVTIATSPIIGNMFNLTELTVGASQVIPPGQALTPASPLAGMTMSVYSAEGCDFDDVLPEFGIQYRTQTGNAITITARFAHVHQAGIYAFPARPHLSFLCIAQRIPRTGCQDVAKIFELFECRS